MILEHDFTGCVSVFTVTAAQTTTNWIKSSRSWISLCHDGAMTNAPMDGWQAQEASAERSRCAAW